ncbi:pseudouridylate synthase TRUB1-like isoform X4 [Macrobrachium rosenbergii]|uniref:pseudouridylate synthase TRUB1-like isoform X4 n=1 Tax=Macrobrachium rosenbergii TaxID=79674 RepID=UPI0034D69B8E
MSGSLRKSLNGIFPVLKPHGITSAQLLNVIKEKLAEELSSGHKSAMKMGHGGTLDSTATGIIVVGIGNDCKRLKVFLNSEKSYFVRGQLGIATDTYNETGQILMERRYDHVTENMLQERLKDFEGRIKQTPPVYSALKKDGKRYSDLVRYANQFPLQPTCFIPKAKGRNAETAVATPCNHQVAHLVMKFSDCFQLVVKAMPM